MRSPERIARAQPRLQFVARRGVSLRYVKAAPFVYWRFGVLVTARRAREGSSSESERGAGGAPGAHQWWKHSDRRGRGSGGGSEAENARGNQRLCERVRGGTPRVAAARPSRRAELARPGGRVPRVAAARRSRRAQPARSGGRVLSVAAAQGT